MLLGSLYAGMAFSNSPCAAVHALAYPIGKGIVIKKYQIIITSLSSKSKEKHTPKQVFRTPKNIVKNNSKVGLQMR